MKNESKDWTEPAHLDQRDWAALKEIQRLHAQGLMKEAMQFARNTDTIVREEIPPQIWLDMGGTLTRSGLEKLQQSKENNKSKSKDR